VRDDDPVMIAAVLAYAAGLAFEVIGLVFLLRRIRAWNSTRVRMGPTDRFLAANALQNTDVLLQRLEQMERATLTVGWPLAALVCGIAFGYAGNFLSLVS
jgi:hypothetical protein